MKDKGGLTTKQRLFVEALPAVGYNQTEAAKQAGYSPHAAQQIASENMCKPLIREAIEGNLAARKEQLQLTAQDIVSGVLDMISKCSDPGLKSFNPAAVASFYALLGKHTGGFGDRPDGEQVSHIKISIERAPDRRALPSPSLDDTVIDGAVRLIDVGKPLPTD